MRTGLSIGLGTLVGLGALSCEPTPPQPAEPPEAGRPPGIRIYTRTAGRNLDPDGYVVTLNGGQPRTVGVNDSVSFDPVAMGSHVLELTGVARNCWTSDTPVTIEASTGPSRVAFDVLCAGPVPEYVEISFAKDGVVYGMRADGSGITDLTGTGHLSFDPAWSPEGSRLAFVSDHDDERASIWVLNADGSGLMQLTQGPAEREPAWSPDGTKIVFRRGPQVVSAGDADLYVVDATGGNKVDITPSSDMHDDSPAWSPDGSRIAFERTITDYTDLFVRDLRDGSDHNLTNDRSYDIINREPSWSPDGSRLAYRRGLRGSYTGYDIWLMNSDGSQRDALIAWPDVQMDPAWSPDGTTILFTSFVGPGGARRDAATIFGVAVAGGQVTELTAGGSASWRPRPPGGVARR